MNGGKQQPYQKPAHELAESLDVWPAKGLDSQEAAKRSQEFGPNQLESKKTISPFKLLLSQFKDVLIIVLIIAAGISLALGLIEEHGSPTEGILILIIVLAIAVVGFLNEYKAEKTVEELKKLVGHKAKVRRDGKEIEIDASELVPGDVVLLEEGQKVPADIRLLEARSLRMNEASLTGESLPVTKQTEELGKTVSVGDQNNMVFSGTIVTAGTGEGIVAAIGSNTEIGKIATMVSEVEEESTPMQKKLDNLGRQIGMGVILISLFVFAVIFFFNQEVADADLIRRLIFAFTAAVALAVAAIPEGLAFVVRISLALGARRMAAKNALVRRLSAVEALGSTDVVCSDKTGTLTKGEMTVRQIYFGGDVYEVSGSGYEVEGGFTHEGKKIDPEKMAKLLRIGVLCNNAHLDKGRIMGDPTEGSLIVAGEKAGLGQEGLTKEYKRLDEVPFNSERKMMSTLHRGPDKKYLVATKGAPEVVLSRCKYTLKNGRKAKMTPSDKKQILKINNDMTGQALRVLGFAYKESDKKLTEKQIEKDLVFAGLQGMMDPPRKEVAEVIHQVTSEAGMRVIMITGDHVETAKAVAHEIGIKGEGITGIELNGLSEDEFYKKVKDISIYARVNPEHKIRIVKALKKHGHQVAMTGDGVNDAPAIKAADIGVAMGITGTDASKEASDMILLDDQFLTIINAIEEGRGIFDNVRKFVNYLLSANIAEVLAVLFGVLIFQDLVLTAAQLLFINIVTDGLPAIALGSDPAEKGIMRFKPHHFQGTIVNKRIWVEMFAFGSAMTLIFLAHFWFNMAQEGIRTAISAGFLAMVIYEIVRLVDIRTDYKIKWFSNPWLSVAIAGSLILQVSVIYFKPLADLFGVASIQASDWAIIAVGSVVLFVFMKMLNPVLDRLMPEVAETH